MSSRRLNFFTKYLVDRSGEYWFFLRWLMTTGEFYATLKWAINKIIARFLAGQNNLSLYPTEILAITSHCIDVYSNSAVEYRGRSEYSRYDGPMSVRLAGVELNVIDGKVDWHRTFVDKEDEESLHRWNWLLHMLGEKNPKRESLNWSFHQIEDWIFHFQSEIRFQLKQTNRLPRWESYTVSERLSNASIFFCVSDIEPSRTIVEALTEQGEYLTQHLEYRGKNTGNHIVNNARGLYLFGTIFEIDVFRRLGKILLKRELPNLISPNGFVGEGSSHYQFLVTRWLFEVRYFAARCNDIEFNELLEGYCFNLEGKCRFFLPGSNLSYRPPFPLFGDISPDFPPEWLSYLPFSKLSRRQTIISASEQLPKLSWNWIWE